MSFHPLLYPADAGEPMSENLVATAKIARFEFSSVTREVALRNTGRNTLWVLLPNGDWFDVAVGTSWDGRVSISELWYCTQVDRTDFTVIALALVGGAPDDGDSSEDE